MLELNEVLHASNIGTLSRSELLPSASAAMKTIFDGSVVEDMSTDVVVGKNQLSMITFSRLSCEH